MNVKDIFTRLFGTKSIDLISPNDLVNIPTRDILNSDEQVKLDQIKAQYNSVLLQRRYIFSGDLASKDFDAEMLMNFELFSKLIFNRNDDYNTLMMRKFEIEELFVHQCVTPKKIELYMKDMGYVYTETLLRLIALREIYANIDKTLLGNKRRALANEIYNLTTKYVMYNSNLTSAAMEVNSYKIRDYSSLVDESKQEEVFKRYEEKISWYAKKLIPLVLDEILKKNLGIIDRIAHIEKALEIYAYNNLNVAPLNKELEEIDAVEKIPENRRQLFDRIYNLQIKYIVLNDYGLHELDLRPLYEVKFDIVTIDSLNNRINWFKDASMSREFKYYEDIIARKIETNIIGDDSILSNLIPEEDNIVILAIFETLKTFFMVPTMVYEVILRDRFLLNLVLSSDSLEHLKYLFDNYKTSGYDERIYELCNEMNRFFAFSRRADLPLSTLCQASKIARHNNLGIIYDYFVSKDKNDKVLRIPEGITEIYTPVDTITLPESMSVEVWYYDGVRKAISNKEIIMPSTLEKIDYYIPTFEPIPKIVLNEGLQVCNTNLDFTFTQTESLTIPSTLRELSLFKNNLEVDLKRRFAPLSKIPRLIFTNFEDSIMLNDEEIRHAIVIAKCLRTLEECPSHNGLIPGPKGQISYNLIELISTDEEKYLIDVAAIVSSNFDEAYIKNRDCWEKDKTEFLDIVYNASIDDCEESIMAIIKDINNKKTKVKEKNN